MPIKSKKKPIVRPMIKSRRRARKMTSEFHRLIRELEKAKECLRRVTQGKGKELTQHAKQAKRVNQLTEEINRMRESQVYQDASVLSTSYHKTSRWVLRLINQFGLRQTKSSKHLKLLEVGAVNTQLVKCPYLDVRAIDLKPTTPLIECCDFFTLQPNAQYDILVSSMVLNYVAGKGERNVMMRLYVQHLCIKGYLFLVLPKRTLTEKEYMNTSQYEQMMEKLNLTIIESRTTEKLQFYCCQKISELDER